MAFELDFSGRQVLVVGGSNGIGIGIGIGNATVQAFRGQGAQVAVWGTRAAAADYADEAGQPYPSMCHDGAPPVTSGAASAATAARCAAHRARSSVGCRR